MKTWLLFLSIPLLSAIQPAQAEDSSCSPQRAFLSSLSGKAEDVAGFFSLAARTRLLLSGESHLEGAKATRYYKQLIRAFHRKPSRTCLFLEWNQETYEALYLQCILNPQGNREVCLDLDALQDHVYELLKVVHKKHPAMKVFAVDLPLSDIPGNEVEVQLARNRHMAQEIAGHMAKNCERGIFLGGASHLTENAPFREQSIPSLLRAKGIDPLVAQIFTTQEGEQGGEKMGQWDHRWHVSGRENSCEPSMPVGSKSWMVRGEQLPEHPLVLKDFFNADPDRAFGRWKDFQFSINVDGYQETSAL